MAKLDELKNGGAGSEVLSYIDAFGRAGPGSFSPDSAQTLRAYGIYSQRPTEPAFDETVFGEGHFFMVRIRIPGGRLTSTQLSAIADVADLYGRGLADITVRQNIQLHWVTPGSLSDVVSRLIAVGLYTTETCGDTVRNIVNCPVSGVDESELYDTTELIRQVNDFFVGNSEFSDLPRKLKITISGCALRCVYPEINDVGIFAVRDLERGGVAFRARVGGGLSTSPRFAQDLGVMVEPDQVVGLCAAIASVFRDEGDREDRSRGRLKFLVEQWDVPRFRAEVEQRLGLVLRRAPSPQAPPIEERDRSHLGIHRQHTPGLYYVGLSVLGGRTSGDELRALAALATRYGSGRIRTTNTQNVILLDVDGKNLGSLTQELDAAGFVYKPNWAEKAVIACTGIQFCKLAVAETKNRAAELSAFLAKELELEEPIRISVTGCPNSCGQHHICDVGLEGSVTTVDGARQEAFQVILGGGVGVRETIGRRIGVRIPSDDVADALVRLLSRYKELKVGQETFQQFCLRWSDEALAGFLTPGGKISAGEASGLGLPLYKLVSRRSL
ncbi:MAG TPA: nitrite/sulfite reductase [Blastocatellia bacterium]|nr:nitrite/sulfite reductase [Blastocatellia bacterium]